VHGGSEPLIIAMSVPGALYAGFVIIHTSFAESTLLFSSPVLPSALALHAPVVLVITVLGPKLLGRMSARHALKAALVALVQFGFVAFLLGFALSMRIVVSNEIRIVLW